MKIYLSNILQGSGPAVMGRAFTWVEVDGIFYFLYVCKDITLDEHMNRVLIVKENPVWIKTSGVIIHVVRDLVKAHAWPGLVVVVVVVVSFLYSEM